MSSSQRPLRLTKLLVVLVSAAVVATVAVTAPLGAASLGVREAGAQVEGVAYGEIPGPGEIGLLAWEGTLDGLRAAASVEGCVLQSVWATVDGRFVGYTFGQPEFVNAPFVAEVFVAEVGDTLDSERVLLVVC